MDVDANRKIGSCLQAIRREANLTQTELANRIGKPQSYVSKIEIGERNLLVSEFFSYARALGLSADKLIMQIEKTVFCGEPGARSSTIR